MEDNRPLMTSGPIVHWILSFRIVLYSLEFLPHSVGLGEYCLVLENDNGVA